MYGVYIIQATTKHTTIWICIFFFRQHINFDGAEYLSVFFFEDSFAYGTLSLVIISILLTISHNVVHCFEHFFFGMNIFKFIVEEGIATFL